MSFLIIDDQPHQVINLLKACKNSTCLAVYPGMDIEQFLDILFTMTKTIHNEQGAFLIRGNSENSKPIVLLVNLDNRLFGQDSNIKIMSFINALMHSRGLQNTIIFYSNSLVSRIKWSDFEFQEKHPDQIRFVLISNEMKELIALLESAE
jgi:hypothetical protein